MTAGDWTADTGLLLVAPGLAGAAPGLREAAPELAELVPGLLGTACGLATVTAGLFGVVPGVLEGVAEAQLQRPHVLAQKPFGFAELVVSMKEAEHWP